MDTFKEYVWEPAVVKINALTAATEAACLILSVDETVRFPMLARLLLPGTSEGSNKPTLVSAAEQGPQDPACPSMLLVSPACAVQVRNPRSEAPDATGAAGRPGGMPGMGRGRGRGRMRGRGMRR